MLRLVGHYNPFGEYPARVVPICADDDGTLIALRGGQLTRLPPEIDFVRHLSETVESFDESRALFAHTQEHVVRFRAADEKGFFRRLVDAGELHQANPFILLSISTLISDASLVTTALRQCVLELGGPRDAFASQWYEQELPYLRRTAAALPPSPRELLKDAITLRVACHNKHDRPALTALTRSCNGRSISGGDRIVLLQAVDGHEDAGEPESDCLLAPMESLEESSETPPLVAGEVVLVLDPALKSRFNETPRGWREVFRRVLDVPGFKWTRPRHRTPLGDLVDLALVKLFAESAETRHADVGMLSILASKIPRYADTDEAAIDFVGNLGGRWQLSAFVAQRHRILSLVRDLAVRAAPILVPFEYGGLGIPYVLRRTTQAPDKISAQQALATYLGSDMGANDAGTAGFAAAQPINLNAVAAARTLAVRYERPIAAYIVADVSSSMTGLKLAEAKVGMSTFLGQFVADRGDMLGLITFSSEVEVRTHLDHLSTVADALGTQIAALEADGRTALLDAVTLAVRALADLDPRYICAIVVLTDGQENASSTSHERLFAELADWRAEDKVLYGLAYGDDADFALLEQLSGIGGGIAYRGTVNNIRKLFSEIARAL